MDQGSALRVLNDVAAADVCSLPAGAANKAAMALRELTLGHLAIERVFNGVRPFMTLPTEFDFS